MLHQIKKLGETIRDYQGRFSEISRKVMEVKGYINELTDQNHNFRERLKSYEQENTGIGNDLELKENKIDNLERVFAEKHELIKNQVENYIELEHQNERSIKEARHKLNLIKIESQKNNELTSVISSCGYMQEKWRKMWWKGKRKWSR